MRLASGVRIGPYEIVAPLGAGGMGEVYRARDSRLHRDVAIKILPESLAADPDRLARFEREAQLLASLNHPHVAHIHGIEESQPTAAGPSGAVRALVMELVDGPTLVDRIAQGALPLDEALEIARQIADGLDAAHERGVIHRDLKPANIRLTTDGQAKILDFGLAKALESSSAADAANSPTMTSPAMMTRAGIILGTAAYMSPEQARGRAVDKRADVWAFGCVLYEMLSGHALFGGESVTETLAAVMRDEPRLDALPRSTPTAVRTLLARCLERDPKRRLRDIGEARIALEHAIAHPSESVGESRVGSGRPTDSLLMRAVPWIVAAAAVGAAAYLLVARSASSGPRDSFEVELGAPPNGQFLIDSNSGNVLLSPDGTKIVFRAAVAGRDALWVRSLARDDARQLTGTENAQYPFWAPDSRRLGFFANGKLKTLDTAAGLPQAIAEASNGRGGSWGDDDVILFAPRGGGTISRVQARGGTATVVTQLDTNRGENAHYWPQILPGGRKFLYFVRSFHPEHNGIYIAAVDGTGATRLVSSLSSGIYAPPLDGHPGQLLWVQNGDLLAQPFDADRGILNGQPVPIASGVRVLESQRGVLASVSRTGAVVWASSRAASARFAWYDRSGRRGDTVPLEEGEVRQQQLSPDGSRLLYTRVANGTADVYLFDLASRSSRRISPSPDYDEQPSWSPDGAEIFYTGSNQGFSTLIRVRQDGSASPVELMRDADQMVVMNVSPDGRHVLVRKNVPGAGMDLLVFPAGDPKAIAPLLTGPFNDGSATAYSPDGRWLAFTSDRSGRDETYVVRFLGDRSPPALGGEPVQISTDGGSAVLWRRDAREIVLLSADAQVISVPVELHGESVSAGRPTVLFRLPSNQSNVATTPNADRFLVSEYPYAAGQTIHLLTNWQERLGR
jgi:eukaryotic-like serine/threonine-protein kinase